MQNGEGLGDDLELGGNQTQQLAVGLDQQPLIGFHPDEPGSLDLHLGVVHVGATVNARDIIDH